MSSWTPAELDMVIIPDAIAREHGVVPRGTIVWHVAGAPIATVECTRVGSRLGLDTEVFDVSIADLRPDLS